MNVRIEESWKEALAGEFEKDYFRELVSELHREKAAGTVIYPPGPLIFNAFDKTPLPSLKVVILGQDPYHNPGEAMGLSFSVPDGVRIPPSLRNIFKEIESDLGIRMSGSSNLEPWFSTSCFSFTIFIMSLLMIQPVYLHCHASSIDKGFASRRSSRNSFKPS